MDVFHNLSWCWGKNCQKLQLPKVSREREGKKTYADSLIKFREKSLWNHSVKYLKSLTKERVWHKIIQN